MPTYLYCGWNIVSNIAILELSKLNVGKTRILFSLESARQQSKDCAWSYQWSSPNGKKLISYRKQASCHWLRFPELADFQIASNAKEIICFPLPVIPVETIRHLLLDQVLPRCLAHQGRVMLHASAVRLEHGVLLFLGDSGAGKSTLAGDFHQAGNLAVSDDCLWLKEGQDHVLAVPAYGGLRLWDDSLAALFPAGQQAHSMAHYSSKKRVPLDEGVLPSATIEYPVLAMIVLSPSGLEPGFPAEICLEKLSRREAFIALLKQTFQLEVTDLERMARHAQALGQIVPRLPAYRLRMPRDYALLPQVRQKILETVLAPKA